MFFIFLYSISSDVSQSYRQHYLQNLHLKLLAYLFLFFCFYPYIDIFGLGTDTQPNALLFGSILFLGIPKKKVNTPIILLWLLLVLSMLLVFYNNQDFVVYIKNTANYYSLALGTTTSYYIFSRLNIKVPFKIFLIIIGVYAAVALIQFFLFPTFFVFMLNMARGVLVGGRGVVSITTEPAYYGTMCLFFMIFSLIYYDRKQNQIAQPILLIQLLALSMSATAVGLLLASIFLFTIIQLLRLKWRYILSSIFVLMITIPLLIQTWDKMQDSRMGLMASEVVKNPLLITQLDGSVAIRFTSAVAPFLAIRHNHFAPMGLGYYGDFLENLYEQGYYRSFIRFHILEKKYIGGGINTVLFQLGIFGWLFPLALYLAFRKMLYKDGVKFALILFVFILFTQIQLMNGMIGLIIGLALSQSRVYSNLPDGTFHINSTQ